MPRGYPLPCSEDELQKLAAQYPTPFHLYDEKMIETVCSDFKNAFAWAEEKGTLYKNFFAVKATPNPVLMKLLKTYGMGFDCSSIGELKMCEMLGYTGEDLMFTSNNTAFEEYRKAAELGALINLDDYCQIECLAKALSNHNMPFPEILCFRYNPGPARTGNVLIGEPVEAKYGLTRSQLFKAYEDAQRRGTKRFGLHTMVISNSLDLDELIATVEELFKLAVDLKEKLGINLDFVNFGGGVGVAYKPEQTSIDFAELGARAKAVWEQIIAPKVADGLNPKLFYECGRVITCDAGYIISRVKNMKDTYKRYVGVDATMADLMRPGMYGAYHHITIVKDPTFDKTDLPDFKNLLQHENYASPDFEGGKKPLMYDVTGSLCENNDKFCIDRTLNVDPDIGDICVIHQTGAHGHSMGFNYNAKMRHAEVLRTGPSASKVIRHAETMDNYLATVKEFF